MRARSVRLGIMGVGFLAGVAFGQYGVEQVPQPYGFGRDTEHAPPFAAETQVTGNVAEVDHGDGALVLDSGRERLRLRFPPDALSGIRRGDRVTVALALRPSPEGTSSTGGGSPALDPEAGSPGARPPAARPTTPRFR